MNQVVNDCIHAAQQQQRDGMITGWQVEGTDAVSVTMLMPDYQRTEMQCNRGMINRTTTLLGGRDFGMLHARQGVSEAAARAKAGTVYSAGNLRGMEYTLDWFGNPYYRYSLTTPDGREAVVEIDAKSGKIESTHSDQG